MNVDGERGEGKKNVTIIVNGRRHELAHKEDLSFAEVVDIAFPGQTQGGNICFTVTFKRGHGNRPEGTLAEGEALKVKEGMVFNVTRTDKS